MAEAAANDGVTSPVFVASPALAGYRDWRLLQATSRHKVFRGRRADGQPVVVKIQNGGKFTSSLVEEHALLTELAAEPGVVNALELIRDDKTCALVMEAAGDSLASLIAQHAPRPSQPQRSSSPSAADSIVVNLPATDFRSLARRLDLAVAIAAALERIHARDIIHLDIKPHNVLVDPVTGRVTLCDFGSAIRLAAGSNTPTTAARSKASGGDKDASGATPRMVGSPPYMAPEQTGRTMGGLDARTDLYGFGVLLYQLFTFRLPFECASAAEYIQAHLARAPPPPRRVLPSLPVAIDAIIIKLLNKDKERRYESAHGVKADLALCLAELTATGTIPDTVQLGARDRSGALRAPQQLWGREPELARLVAVMAAARAGGRVCALVDGPSGVGKTALIEEARKRINDPYLNATVSTATSTRAAASASSMPGATAAGASRLPPTRAAPSRLVVASGKGEQARRVPYSTLDQAMGQLVASLQMEGNKAVGEMSKSLHAALEGDVNVLAAALPSVQSLLGTSDGTTLDGDHAHARFSSALLRFFQCVATVERTCVLYIDDIQWCDESTLRSLDGLLGSDRLTNFMILCAYRTTELPAPLSKLLASADGFVQATTITVKGLMVDDVTGLISDVLGTSTEGAVKLAAVCTERTGGNPLHVMEVLRFLHASHLLAFDQAECTFKWDIHAVRSAVTSTPDVAEMVLQRMGATLSGDAATVLLTAAFVGAQFGIDVVQRAAGLPADTVRAVLQATVADGIVEYYLGPNTPFNVPVTGDTITSVGNGVEMLGEERFRFLHDKIHEAASRLQPEKWADLHASLGMILFQQLQSQSGTIPSSGKLVFEVCDHLNAALALGASLNDDVMSQLVSLNMEAAKAARQLMAFPAAMRYLEAARKHLQLRALSAVTGVSSASADKLAEDGMWAYDYQNSIRLTVERISVALQLDEEDVAQEAIASGLEHARSPTDRGKILVPKIYTSLQKTRMMEGLETMKQALSLMGRAVPETNTEEFTQTLNDKHRLQDVNSVDRWMDLPLATDEFVDVVASVLGGGMMIVFLTAPSSAFFAAVCALAWDIVLEHGITARFCGPLAVYCALLVCRSEYVLADRVSQVIRELIRKYNFRAAAPEPLALIGAIVYPWARPLKDAHSIFAEAVKLGREEGDYNFVCYGQLQDNWFKVIEGQHLASVMRGIPEQIAFGRSVANLICYPSQRVILRICAKLMRHERFVSLLRECGEADILGDEAALEASLAGSSVAEWSYLALMGWYHVLMDNPAEAIVCLDKSEPKALAGVILTAVSNFMQIMAHTRLHGTDISTDILARLDGYRAKIATCAESAPFNWSSMLALADAELMRVRGCPTSAVISSIASMIAQESAPTAKRCPWLLGLAHETAARAWEQEESLPFDYREFHLRAAIAAYRDWGATAKAERVRQVPRAARAGSRAAHNTSTPPSPASRPLADHDSPSNEVSPSPEMVTVMSNGDSTASVTKDLSANTTDLDALFLLKGFQVISAEVRADRVYEVALPVLVESSGAQHAMMINLVNEGELTLAAKFSEDTNGEDARLPPFMRLAARTRITGSSALLSLLHVTAETREPHVVEDALRNAQYWNDEYVVASKPRSILCAPLLTRGKLTALLYMENNLYPGTFAHRQLTFIKALLNQVSISVENARLYASVEEDTMSLHGSVAQRDDEMRNAQAVIKTVREGAVLTSQAQSAWLATVVHELRTPISAVISLAQQLLAAPISPEQRENVEIIRSSSDNLVKQVDDILEASRREVPKLTFTPERTDLRRCFTDCCLVIRVQAAAKQLRLVTELDADLPAVVLIDALRVRQIVINLLGNAVKFTDRGAVTLRLSARQVSVPDPSQYDMSKVPPLAPWYELHCQVVDTGVGISSEGISHLFTAFEQVDTLAERRILGTGLGLAISKNLTDLMGGRIWVESVLNQGATFHFTFICPAVPQEAPALAPVVSASQPVPATTQSTKAGVVDTTGAPSRVLIVDDSPVNLKILQKLLVHVNAKMTTTLAASGAEALAAVSQSRDQPFDVIFMDVHMAGMDGAEVACAIRAMDLPVQPRIFAFTADATFEESETAKCFDAVLLKPLMLTDLMAALRTARPTV